MDLLEIEKLIDEAAKKGDKIVNLSHRGLTIVTSNVDKLLNVRKLSLNDNQLLMPPTELSSLLKLEELVLDKNRLTMLPVGIGKLSNLEYLSVCFNPLGTLPSEIGQLTTLTQLWAAECQLMSLPPEIGKLTNLEKLSVRGNNLASLPAEITNLKKLVWLNLGENQLRELPALNEIKSICHLDLNNNKFECIPSCVLKLPQLASLHMKGNYIKSVSDDTILALSGLTKLDLRDNDLKVKPSHWKGLEYILIGGTNSRSSKCNEDLFDDGAAVAADDNSEENEDDDKLSPYAQLQRALGDGESDEDESKKKSKEPCDFLSGWKVHSSDGQLNHNEL